MEEPEPGRREQKRQETRERLTRVAQDLFLAQGFERITVDEIAVAAGVSRRTFFHHFASKEDVVLLRHEDFERTLVAAIRGAPSELRGPGLAEHAVQTALGRFDPEEARLVERLKRDTPALRVRDQGKYESLERAAERALAARAGTTSGDLRTRLEAVLVVGVLRVVVEGWVEAADAGVSTGDHVRQVVRALEASLTG